MKRFQVASVLAISAALGCAVPSWAEPPAIKLISGSGLSPSDALAFYGSGTTHTVGTAAWSDGAPEIKALAVSLGAGSLSAADYTQNSFNYVRNNIAVEYRFGLGKGARGALLEQSGTGFDQAELLVKLLRAGGVQASYQVGVVTLTAQEFGTWTGLVKSLNQSAQTFSVNAKAACQFLASGGTPALVNGAANCSGLTGDVSSVQFLHAWVSVGGVAYDPTIKPHDLYKGLDVYAAMGCGSAAAPTCATTLINTAMSGAQSGSTAGSSWLSTLNYTNASPVLHGYAKALQSTIQANNRDDLAVAVVGGKRLKSAEALAGVSYAYSRTSSLSISGEIPDQYRTKLTIAAPACTTQTVFADELAGRRVSYSGTGSLSTVSAYAVYLDGTGTTCSGTSSTNAFVLTVDHPYAASSGAYGDDTVTLPLVEPTSIRASPWANSSRYNGISNTTETSWVGSFPVTLIFSLGEASPSAQKFMSDLASVSPVMTAVTCRPSSTTPVFTRTCENDRQPVSATTISANRTLAGALVDGLTGTVSIRHHDVGLIYSSRLTGVNYSTLQGVESIVSSQDDATAVARALTVVSALAPSTEGTALAGGLGQVGIAFNVPHTSQLGRFSSSGTDVQIHNVPSGSMQTFLAQYPDSTASGGFDSWRKTLLQEAANAGYDTIISPGSVGEIFIGSSRQAYTQWENLKGAVGVSDPLAAVSKTVERSDGALRARQSLSPSLADGRLSLQASADIVSGQGEFPYSLPFIRTYAPSNYDLTRYADLSYYDVIGGGTVTDHTSMTVFGGGRDATLSARLGGGWSHNYNATAIVGGDSGKAWGRDTALEASQAIAAVAVMADLAGAESLQRRLIGAWASDYFSYATLGNSISVTLGGKEQTFYRLPDGIFTDRSGGQVTWADWSGMTYVGRDGDVVQFVFAEGDALVSSVPTASSSSNYVATKWTFPNGIAVNFTYGWSQITRGSSGPVVCYWGGSCSNSSSTVHKARVLTQVSNSLGRSLSLTLAALTDVNSMVTGYRISAVTDENGRSATYSVNCSTYTCGTFSVVTPNGAKTTYAYDADTASPDPAKVMGPNYHLRRIFTPNDASSPAITIAYDELLRVKSVTDANGHTELYRPGGVAGVEPWKLARKIAPSAAATQYVFDDRGSPMEVTDPLGRRSTTRYDALGRKLEEKRPEGDRVVYSYDARGNVLSAANWNKGGSSALTTSTAYGELASVLVCTSPKTCNKPASETDARGNTTNYTWSSGGDLTQILSPADASGKRPQTDLGYTAYTGTDAASFSLLTSKVVKIDDQKSLTTTYAYDASKAFALKSVTVDPSGESLTTCLGYDAQGNLTQMADPRGGACQ